jgi:hypothetical protein
MSLADEVAKRKARERADAARRANPELEARLDQFIAKNPVLRERFSAISKEKFVRELMLARMERAEVTVRRNRELEQWVNENPDIVAKVEQRVKTTVAQNRQRAGISAVKTESASQGQRAPRLQP